MTSTEDIWLYSVSPNNRSQAVIVNDEGETFFQAAAPFPNEVESMAQRACACVNACADMPLDLLTGEYANGGISEAIYKLNQDLFKLRNERDDLAEQVECLTIVQDNMASRLNRMSTKLAAAQLERDEMRKALENINQAIEHTPLGIRAIVALQQSRDVLKGA